jgi:hypothetical protein
MDLLRYEISLGESRQFGQAATGGLLALSDGSKTIAAAFNHMQ